MKLADKLVAGQATSNGESTLSQCGRVQIDKSAPVGRLTNRATMKLADKLVAGQATSNGLEGSFYSMELDEIFR
ncbi:MAG: hypothetical protein K2Y12_04290 [Chitinophagaceae bacterium]|nr:hypothetical protein [Chitinophagaceae bacterium]